MIYIVVRVLNLFFLVKRKDESKNLQKIQYTRVHLYSVKHYVYFILAKFFLLRSFSSTFSVHLLSNHQSVPFSLHFTCTTTTTGKSTISFSNQSPFFGGCIFDYIFDVECIAEIFLSFFLFIFTVTTKSRVHRPSAHK